MKDIKNKIIAIVGPTASGKTGVGVRLAKELDGEIISADSRQVYRGLDLGTGKDLAEYDDVKYHLIDVIEPGERFTLFDYLPLARKAIEEVFSRGKVPIIVGGTGLYIQALTEGFGLEKSEVLNPKLARPSGGSETNSEYQTLNRTELENLTTKQLQKVLKRLDIKTYKTIDLNNPHRLIRAIERTQEGNIPAKSKPDFEVLQIGLTWPKEVLDSRIDKRVEERFDRGMLEEIINLLNQGVSSEWLMSLGLEYREITDFIISKSKFLTRLPTCRQTWPDGQVSNCSNYSNKIPNLEIPMLKSSNEFNLMKDQLKLRIRQFSKRQMTWFRRFPEIVWENDYNKISKIAKKYLKSA